VIAAQTLFYFYYSIIYQNLTFSHQNAILKLHKRSLRKEVILLDTIITTTLALRKRRNRITNVERRRKRFQNWVCSLNPEFYVFYRVNGVNEFVTNPNIQVKLYLTPLFQASHAKALYPLFDEAFVLFARIDCVQSYNQRWLSIDATAKQFPGQSLTVQSPPQYLGDLEDKILPKLAFPANIRGKGQSTEAYSFDLCKMRFYKFHLFFHQDEEYKKRYGVIDRMWDPNGKELQLSLPPNLDFGEPDTKDEPKNHFLNPSQKPSQSTSSLEDSLKSFLKDYRSNTSYKL
jgi:hypothetical protein